ncbi:sporulation-induced protein [Marasmius crinis-equi]|uniref:Sporulation-induced protein n=1 Tax=Marasmius crinis-equi TaxID=585013 RepID=A0ABR3FMB8_9AGAR
MISAFFIFNQKGEVLISRLYRTDFKRSIADVFRIQVVSNSDVRSPIITLGSTSFFHVRINNLYVVAVTKNNANAALVFEFCYRFINICKSYFGKIDEESIKNNFVLIYELIDEINDFGYPQNSEIDTLKTYITTESVVSAASVEDSSKITAQATGATSWRRGDVKYKKNEAFVDVVEVVNLSMSAKGNILRADVDGHIQMRAYLSGTPECKFGLNDKLVIDRNDKGTISDAVELDDCQFHQCVRLNDFDADRSISFIPPDGEFELMKYRATSNVKLPLRVIATITEIGTTKVSYDVTVKTNFHNKLSATGVVLRIPTPLNTTNVECQVATGKAKYVPAENVVIWKIPRMQGGQECTFSAAAELTSTTTRQVWARPPIDVDFQVLMFTASGLIVRFLKVFEKNNYQSIKWVRYLTKANGSYQIRGRPFGYRFGFHNASTIDSLLNKEDVSLEAILDQDDLLQECKAQNTRLIDYFQRVDVLQRLFGYVTGQIEGEEGGRFKYPYVATEVLCSDIWSIVETCVNEHQQILAPFWETVLETSPDDMKTQLVMASHFSKITSIYLAKKPTEMFEFLQSVPDVVGKLLKHIGNPSFVDVLIRIIQLDDIPEGDGVLEWLHSEGLINRLIDLLAPSHSSDTQQIAADMLNAIIAMATPSPGAAVLVEQPQAGLASNLFARELARPEYISRLIVYIFQDFASDRNPSLADDDDDAESDKHAHPIFEYASSSAVLAMGVVSELIRKNNSDYFEPYLFHTLRHRLLQVQNQQLQEQVSRESEESREGLERAMKEMVDRMGVVNLNYLLEVLCDRTETLIRYLDSPRSWKGPEPTTVGSIMPLTFERLRIVELFAEMLHCSNMSLLNRSSSFDHLYDSSGRLQGGLSAMKDLGAVSEPHAKNQDDDMMDDGNEIEPALEFPVTSTSHDSSLLDSDDDMSSEPGSSDDDAMEEIIMSDEPQPIASPRSQDLPGPLTNRPSTPPDNTNNTNAPPNAPPPISDRSSPDVQRSPSSRRSSRRMTLQTEPPPDTRLFIGEQLKKKFLDLKVPCKLLDLFFEYPWNNFLHSAVFDVISQMMSGPVEAGSGWNRELVISLFRDARIMHRLVEGHKLNAEAVAKPKGLRLGYMAHLHRLTEAVLECLTRYPPELRVILVQYAPDPGWDEYITTTFQTTREDNSKPLGGGKPNINSAPATRGTRWKVDEEDPNTLTTITPAPGSSNEDDDEARGDLRRDIIGRPPKNTADFGTAPMDDFDSDEDEEDDGHDPAPHFTRYLAHQMGNADNFGSPSSSEDDDDDEGGWLSQSTFSLGNPPMTNLRRNDPERERERRPLAENGFEDVFQPNSNNATNSSNPFSAAEDDDFGPFSDSNGASGSDPFTFPTSFSPEELDESSFESFGDFGDFQSADELQDGELTPTGGSWTFASDSSLSDSSASRGSSEPQSPMEEKRMPAAQN